MNNQLREPQQLNEIEQKIGRSKNYYVMTPEQQWVEDKALGILDWDGSTDWLIEHGWNRGFEKTKKYLNVKTKQIAEYDSFMGLYYIKGLHYSDGPMIPFRPYEIEQSEDWKPYFKP